jgi:hypothetical protein
MTDRGQSALRQTPDSFTVGPSSLRWEGGKLIIDHESTVFTFTYADIPAFSRNHVYAFSDLYRGNFYFFCDNR